jgi:Fe-Mn family superoxide dismutase
MTAPEENTDMTELSRRSMIGAVSAGAAGLAMAGSTAAAADVPALVPAFAGGHQPRPLRFDPARLEGISEKLIQSHWENNYQGAVRTLNMIEQRLAAAMADKDYPPSAYGGLKREELLRTGSVVLHELYFGGLGGNGQAAGGIRQALAAAFGSFEAWEAEFRRTAMSLAGGSGWCVLAWNRHTASPHNYWCWDHSSGPPQSVPLVVLDMYEHAYHMDYGAAAAKYIDAFLRNLDWEVVEARYRAVAPA